MILRGVILEIMKSVYEVIRTQNLKRKENNCRTRWLPKATAFFNASHKVFLISLRRSKPSLELTYFPKACKAAESTGVSHTTFASSRQKTAYVALPHFAICTLPCQAEDNIEENGYIEAIVSELNRQKFFTDAR